MVVNDVGGGCLITCVKLYVQVILLHFSAKYLLSYYNNNSNTKISIQKLIIFHFIFPVAGYSDFIHPESINIKFHFCKS